MEKFGRHLAPISSEAWAEIDGQVARSLKSKLSARYFADVSEPKGPTFGAVNIGRLRDKTGECGKGTCAGVREVLPLVEARTWFELPLSELHDIERGAKDVDFTALEEAAAKAAEFEENAVYNGYAAAGIEGLAERCVKDPIEIQKGHPTQFFAKIAEASRCMAHMDAIDGPYVLVGGRAFHEELDKIAGEHSLRRMFDKEIGIDTVCSPFFDGAYLVSRRSGDFELTLGLDYVVGSCGVCDGKVRFFIAESFTFRVIEPRAFVPIRLA